jgi:galactokinase/mevalonate kinase-like predicted kinase
MSYFNDPKLNLSQVGMSRPASAAELLEKQEKQIQIDHAERTYTFSNMMQQAETMRRAAVNYDQQRLAEIFDEAVEILNAEWNKARKR